MNRPKLFFALVILLLLIPLILVLFISFGQDQITPNDEFFVTSKGPSPKVNVTSWELVVDGLVENRLNFSYEDLTSEENRTVTATLKCVEGPFGRAEWKGVTLASILRLAGVGNGTKEVVFHAADGFSSSLTLEDAMDEDMLLAYLMNGEVLPVDHGFPLRLVAPGKLGYKWVKWIVRIELVDYDHKGYWESRGWDDDAELSSFTDWGFHAILLSLGFVFGGLALVSGYKGSKAATIFRRLPDFVTSRFHRLCSLAYLVTLFAVFLLWAYLTYVNRGDLFYTSHGMLALAVIVLHAIGGITGRREILGRRPSRENHGYINLFAFALYGGAILTGILRAYGTGL